LSKMDMTESIFVDPGMKVNGQYYRDVLLTQQILRAIKHVAVAGDTFVFQQDSAPSHRAKNTTARNAGLHWSWSLATKQPKPESSGLKDLGVMPQRVYECRVNSVDELKQRLVEV